VSVEKSIILELFAILLVLYGQPRECFPGRSPVVSHKHEDADTVADDDHEYRPEHHAVTGDREYAT
jgi:hypothetical protein